MHALLLATLLLTATADAPFWQYTDRNGVLHVTNDPDSIPPALRDEATPFEFEGERATDAPAPLNEADVEQALREGVLTEEELQTLLSEGALRSSPVGDSYRHARTPSPDQPESSGGHLDALIYEGAPGTLATMSVLQAYLRDLRESDKFWWSLGGQAALILAAIIALPFLLRRYHSPETRRVVRASVFWIVIIVSATGQVLLFRAETETLGRILLNLGDASIASTNHIC